eukprot:c16013_g2_i1.p1 GENE.c16013_g2_i1~~c16013_g2_i1.p1  ORF type:complete len:671 (-),score=160.09 c16013_g2_i1:45-2057(-)
MTDYTTDYETDYTSVTDYSDETTPLPRGHDEVLKSTDLDNVTFGYGCSKLVRANKLAIVEYVMYFLFMITLIIVVNNARPSFYGSNFAIILRQTFSLRQNAVNNADSALVDITEEGMMWIYLRDYFVPNLVQDTYVDGSAKPNLNEVGTILQNMRRIGAVRIRQLRVRQGTCHLRKAFIGSINYCAAPYTSKDQSRVSYGPGLRYTYKTQPGEQLFFIQRRYYPSGGFIEILDTSSRAAATNHIQSLINNSFVDSQTRLLDVRFALFSPYIDRVAVCTIAFEFLAGGGVRPYASFHLVSLTGMPSGSGSQLEIFFEALLYAFVIYQVVVQLVLFCRQRVRYWSHGWNILDLTIVLLFMLLFAFRMQSVAVLADFEFAVADSQYVDFSKVEFIRTNERRTLAFVIFLSFLKCFKFLQSNPKLAQLVNTLEEASSDMVLFVVVILIVLFGFSFAAQLLFGELIADFSQFSQTLAKLVRMGLGDSDYDNLSFVDFSIGPLFFFIFTFLFVFFLLQMFLAIIMGAHERVMAEAEEQKWAGADPGPLTMAWILTKNLIRRILGIPPIRILTEAEKVKERKTLDLNRDGLLDTQELNRFIQTAPSKTPELLGVDNAADIYRCYALNSPDAFNLYEQRTFFSVLDERRQHIVLMTKLLSLKKIVSMTLSSSAAASNS